MNLLHTTILLIGTLHGIHKAHLPGNVVQIVDAQAEHRFVGDPFFYQDRWGMRAQGIEHNLDYHPDIVVVIGRKNLSDNWDGEPLLGATVTCTDHRNCLKVIKQTLGLK